MPDLHVTVISPTPRVPTFQPARPEGNDTAPRSPADGHRPLYEDKGHTVVRPGRKA